MRVWLTVMVLFAVASCSKANNIDSSTKTTLGIGQQCTGADDKGCGVSAVCALGVCRSGCTSDAECTKGALCVGDRPPFGCTLPAELACSSSQPCAAPLTCGIDGKCRYGCKVSTDCIRNEQTCIASGCVSPSDPDTRWSDCVEGESTCGKQAGPGGASCVGPTDPCNQVFVCHRGTPGWSSVGTCTPDGSSTCFVTQATKPERYALCGGPLEPASGCTDYLALPRPGLPCTLGAPQIRSCGDGGKPGTGSTPTYSVLIDGTELKDGFTNNCTDWTLQLSAPLCARLSSGTPDIRIRVCVP